VIDFLFSTSYGLKESEDCFMFMSDSVQKGTEKSHLTLQLYHTVILLGDVTAFSMVKTYKLLKLLPLSYATQT